MFAVLIAIMTTQLTHNFFGNVTVPNILLYTISILTHFTITWRNIFLIFHLQKLPFRSPNMCIYCTKINRFQVNAGLAINRLKFSELLALSLAFVSLPLKFYFSFTKEMHIYYITKRWWQNSTFLWQPQKNLIVDWFCFGLVLYRKALTKSRHSPGHRVNKDSILCFKMFSTLK